MSVSTSKLTFKLLTLAITAVAITSGLVLTIYAYLGFFSRHLADDYCRVNLTATNILSWFWQNYLTYSNRYSNYMLMTFSESISPRSVAFLPALMIVLWVIGIAWLLREASRFAGEPWSWTLIWALSLLFVFFALIQAPNRYQILYWRSSMATHLAPLVFMPWLAAFLIRGLNKARNGSLPFWLYPLAFFFAFLLGGFSEPAMLMLNAVLGLFFLAAWIWVEPQFRGRSLILLGCALAGALTALIVMVTAPAMGLRLNDAPPSILVLLERSFRYAFDFMVDLVRTLPVPVLFTVVIPFLIFFGLYSSSPRMLTQSQRKRVLLVLAGSAIVAYLLIVVSFAPSVYAQSFPVERARFAGQLCFVGALMILGAGLGILLTQWRPRVMEALPLGMIAALLLIIAAFYPLRAAWRTMAEISEYRLRAEFWDERDAQIRLLREQGETDITVGHAPGVYYVKELDANENHWVNRCAADYYGVNSIRAIPTEDQ